MEEYAKSSSEEDEDESVDDIEGTIVSRSTLLNKKWTISEFSAKEMDESKEQEWVELL